MRTMAGEHYPALPAPPGRVTAVLVADPLVRIALRQLLQAAEEVTVVGEGTVEQAADLARRHAPDMVLVDAQRLQDGRLPDFLAALHAASPRTRTIVLCEDDVIDGLVGAARAGAWGYLPREISDRQLARAVRLVLAGRAVMDCALPRELFARLGHLDHGQPADRSVVALTPRETKVIQEMAEGRTDEQIAQQLGVSVPTVKTHVRSILRKTRSRNRTAAIAAAFRCGILR
ncbi:MAG: response regulator transcription factor [Armatimonadota bacterium]|nr:response regulator transcription factor [Armatimonadota bacterium]